MVTVLAVLIVTIGFATEKVKMNLIPLGPEKALLFFNAEKPTSFKLFIKNDKHVIVYYYKSKDKMNVYRGSFDFSELDNGNYRVKLICGNSSFISNLTAGNKRIKTGNVVDSEAPCVNQENDKMNVSFMNVANWQVYCQYV